MIQDFLMISFGRIELMSQEFKLTNGKILLSTEAPGGIYNSAQLKKIASICEKDGAIVKATEDQRIALFVPEENLAAVTKELKSIGLGIRNYQSGLHQPTACLGEMCPDHEQDALGTAMDMSTHLQEIEVSAPVKIGINGCAKCCVPCHTLDIAVIGSVDGYRITLGGKNAQIPEMAAFVAEGIPAADISAKVHAVVQAFKANANESETFHELIERVGNKIFIDALAPYSQDAAGDASAEVMSDAPLEMADVPVEETVVEEATPVEVASEIPQANSDEVELTDEIELTEELDVPVIEVSELKSDETDGVLDLTNVELDEIGSLSEQNVTFSEEVPKATDEEPLDGVEGFVTVEPTAEETESQFEAQIEESIAEQEKIPVAEDGLADDRISAIEQVETEKLDDSSELLTHDFTSDFANIDLEDISSDDIESNEKEADIAEVDESEIADFDDLAVEDLPLSEIVGNNIQSQHVIELNRKPKTQQASSVSFTGFNFDALGQVVLSFSNGANLSLSFDSFGASREQEMDLAGAKLKLVKEDTGIRITINGMQLFVPARAG